MPHVAPTVEIAAPLGLRWRVRLWRLCLDEGDADHARSTLSVGERQRMGRYRSARDAQYFATGRSALKRILSSYLGVPARCISLAETALGRPYLCAYPNLSFNLSRSAGSALVAVSEHVDVGVDIERKRALPAAAELAEAALCDGELKRWRALTTECQPAAALALWVRKEALVKATGLGLQLDPKSFDAGVAGHIHEQLLCINDERRCLQIAEIDIEGSFAAVALLARSQRSANGLPLQ